MKSRRLTSFTARVLLAVLAVAIQPAAQENQEHKHHRYKLVDMGTFGGPDSCCSGTLTRGVTVGESATPTPTLPTSNPLVCGGEQSAVPFVFHAFRWQNGRATDLGALPGASNCSNASSVSDQGEIFGVSENGKVDPLTGVNQTRAVRWKDGEIKSVGSFGGNQNAALGSNKHGQVVGNSLNKVPDPYSFIDFVLLGSSNGTQTRAFLWQHGRMQDLGTLGGDDAVVGPINERGQITGFSYTSSVPNAVTGIPPVDPFLWEKDKGMTDLGTLGGAFGTASGLNNRGQVIGLSSLAANPAACFNQFDPNCHPFLWDEGKLIDLYTSTVGGNPLDANAINDAGEIVGGAAFPNAPLDAYLWRNGVATDLGNLGRCASEAFAINSHDQVVGSTFSCHSTQLIQAGAFLWENGAITDLNRLIPAGASLRLLWAYAINDRGEIAGQGVPHGVSPKDYETMGHAFLLIPCADKSDVEGCEDQDEGISAARGEISERPEVTLPESVRKLLRQRSGHRITAFPAP